MSTPLERLNQLIEKTDQFSRLMSQGRAPSSSSNGKSKLKKSKEEEEEDKELMKDELEQDIDSVAECGYLLSQPTSVRKLNGQGMRPYQMEALNWMIKLHDQHLNGILADEMGLGKTLESISLLCYLKQHRRYAGPHLIIVPKSTSSNWIREINRWSENLSVCLFHGNEEERAKLKSQCGEAVDVTVTTYEMCLREKNWFSKIRWKYIYIDEGHRIKNRESSLAQVVRTFPAEHRLLITGTPLQNNLEELWSLLNFLVPSMFSNVADFNEWFDLRETEQRAEMVSRLHRLLRPFILRRLKTDVECALLPKIETKLYVGLSEMQKFWYTKLLERDLDVLNANTTSKTRLLNIVMQLRKVVNHPYLFNGAEPGPPFVEGEHIVENSGKMVILDRLLKKLQQNGHRVLIFSQMTRLLDILEDYCRYRHYEYCRIDGQTKQEDRDIAIDSYNAPDSNKFIFLLSTRAGGLGINLQTADTVILYDSDWNPQMDLQAQDRAHRIGQKKQVHVFRFVAEDTIEQKIVERATKKLYLDALVIKQGKALDHATAANQSLSNAELQSMVRFGANRIFQSKNSSISDEDIDTMIARGTELTKRENDKLKETASPDLLSFSFSEEKNDFQTFEGKTYGQKSSSSTLEDSATSALASSSSCSFGDDQFVRLPSRAKKTTFYGIDAYYKDVLKSNYNANEEKRSRTKSQGPRPPKPFKPPTRFDFQFFQLDRLVELERKEHESKYRLSVLQYELREKRKEEQAVAKEKEKQQSQTKAKVKDKDLEQDQKQTKQTQKTQLPLQARTSTRTSSRLSRSTSVQEEQEEEEDPKQEKTKKDIDESTEDNEKEKEDGEQEEEDQEWLSLPEKAGCLTEEEVDEKKRLLSEGFGNWIRRHFLSYIKACETYGREDLDSISKKVEEKTPEEVIRYHQVFWSRYGELKDAEKIIRQIEKGEEKVKEMIRIRSVFQHKLKKYGEEDVAKLAYTPPLLPFSSAEWVSRHWNQFTEQEDLFLIACTCRVGYGAWKELEREIKNSKPFALDWFLHSRTETELKERVDYLLRICQEEFEQDEQEQETKKITETCEPSSSSLHPKRKKANPRV